MKKKAMMCILLAVMLSAVPVLADTITNYAHGEAGGVTVYGISSYNYIAGGSSAVRTYAYSGSGYLRSTNTTTFYLNGSYGQTYESATVTADSSSTMDVTATCCMGSSYMPTYVLGSHFAAINGQLWYGSTQNPYPLS